MIAGDNTIQAEELSNFLENVVEKVSNSSKKVTKNVLKNTQLALKIKANVASAVAPGNTKSALSALCEVMNFYHTGKGLHLGKFVRLYAI